MWSLKTLAENLFQVFLWASGVTRYPWHSLAIPQWMPVCLCPHVAVSGSPLLTRVPAIWDEGADLLQYDVISAKDVCNCSISTQGHMLRFWEGNEFGGRTIHPSIYAPQANFWSAIRASQWTCPLQMTSPASLPGNSCQDSTDLAFWLIRHCLLSLIKEMLISGLGQPFVSKSLFPELANIKTRS